MTGPDTRDPDIVKIAKSDLEFRMHVITSLSRIETTLTNHTQEDERRFKELGEKYTGVSSSIGDIDKDRSKLMGIWIGISSIAIALFAVFSAWWKK